MRSSSHAARAARNLMALRRQKPLIHNITNFVVMNYTANALLAMGAAPVMAHAPNEVEEVVASAEALVLNLGTLTEDWVDSMIKAGRKASDLKKPVVLDPVGCGATVLRTKSTRRVIAETRLAVIRGNPSEILSLRNESSKTRGVDSIHSVAEAMEVAQSLALALNLTLAITGAEDFVTDGTRVALVSNGHPMMGRVTGTGCTASAAIGAFTAVDPDPFWATATALSFFGLAGEVAGRHAAAPGSFMVRILDALYTITPEQLEAEGRIELAG